MSYQHRCIDVLGQRREDKNFKILNNWWTPFCPFSCFFPDNRYLTSLPIYFSCPMAFHDLFLFPEMEHLLSRIYTIRGHQANFAGTPFFEHSCRGSFSCSRTLGSAIVSCKMLYPFFVRARGSCRTKAELNFVSVLVLECLYQNLGGYATVYHS